MLEVVVATSDILNAGNSVLLNCAGFASNLSSGIASKMSEVARARRSGSGAEWLGAHGAALRRATG